MIQRAEDVYEYAGFEHIDLAERAALKALQSDPAAIAERPVGFARNVEAVAYVNRGRWVADCPFGRCGSAQVVSPADPRYFCPTCLNANSGAFAPVVFPPAKKLAAIELALSKRPDPANRNWWPHESVRQLRDENDLRLGRAEG